jgi:hypothetical protein
MWWSQLPDPGGHVALSPTPSRCGRVRQSDAVLPKHIVDPALGERVACDARKQPNARRGIEPTMVLPENARKIVVFGARCTKAIVQHQDAN